MPITTRAKDNGAQLRREVMPDIKKFERNGIVTGGGQNTIKLGFDVKIMGGRGLDLNGWGKLIEESLKEAKLASHKIDVGIMFQPGSSDTLTLSLEVHDEIDFKKQPERTKEVGDALISLKAILERKLSKIELQPHWGG